MKNYDFRKRRKELGLTLAQVAKKTKLTTPGVRALENGLFRGKLETRRRLADALGISIRDLMTPEELRATEGPRVLRQAQFFEDVSPAKNIEAALKGKEATPEEALKTIRANWDELKRRGRG